METTTKDTDCEALVAMARIGHMPALRFIDEYSKDKQVKKHSNFTVNCYSRALIEAATYGRLDAVKFLIEKGASLIYTTPGFYRTALTEAAEMGHLPVVEFLIEKGADASFNDHQALSVCMNTIKTANKENPKIKIAECLIKNGGVFITGGTARAIYRNAAKAGLYDILVLMLDNLFDEDYAKNYKYPDKDLRNRVKKYISSRKLKSKLQDTLTKKPADTNIRDKKM